MFPDKKKREHIASVSKVVFHNSDDDFVILQLGDGHSAKGKANPESFIPLTNYRFLGQWREGTRGLQFNFEAFVMHTPPKGPKGIQRYLSTHLAVGNSIAMQLWNKYGEDAISTLRTNPNQIAEDGILDLNIAKTCSDVLEQHSRFESTIVELYELLAGLGIRANAIELMIQELGVEATTKIKENPFVMLGFPSCGFKRCDKLWVQLGHPLDHPIRQALFLSHWIDSNSDGHTWYDWQIAKGALKTEIPESNPQQALDYAINELYLIDKVDCGSRSWVASRDRAIDERRIEAGISRLMSSKSKWPLDIECSKEEGDGLPTKHQWDQLQNLISPIAVLAGGPGTGKTFLLSHLLKRIMQETGSIAICAPTGKAAVRATESLQKLDIPLKATTIHRLLGWMGQGVWEFDRGNPLPYKVVVCDETSMDDSNLLACLLDACADGTLVLLIGDPNQLPPVGHGAPLRDIIDSGAIGIAKLVEVRRNSGAIVQACQKIHKGEPYQTFKSYNSENGENLLHFETKDAQESIDKLASLLRGMKMFHPISQCQVLVAMNTRGSLSRMILNDYLQQLLNPSGLWTPANPFRVGDKVICLKNGKKYLAECANRSDATNADNWQPLRDESAVAEEMYVANGEIGIVLAISKSKFACQIGEQSILVFVGKKQVNEDEGDDKKETTNEIGRGCDFDLAYAISVHKSQGSESPCVIILADKSAGRLCSKEWWYTGISRASKCCITIGESSVIESQRMKPSTLKRKTFLKELIQNSGQIPNEAIAPKGSFDFIDTDAVEI